MFIFKKQDKKDLGKYFNSKEMECHCKYDDCIDQFISETLIQKLDLVREEFGEPLRVTSAFRCAKKQADLRGSGIKTAAGKSTHEMGAAVDIQPLYTSSEKMEKLFKILEKHFKAIGIAKTFYHVDLRNDKIRRWDY